MATEPKLRSLDPKEAEGMVLDAIELVESQQDFTAQTKEIKTFVRMGLRVVGGIFVSLVRIATALEEQGRI
jgi:hypothetical protein